MVRKKLPLFKCWVTGIAGIFDNTSVRREGGDRRDLVSFNYYTFNSITRKKFPILVPQSSIVNQMNNNILYPGVEPWEVHITSDHQGKAPYFDKVFGDKSSLRQEVADLKKQLEDTQIQLSAARNKISELSKDTKKQIAVANEMHKSTTRESSYPKLNNYDRMRSLPSTPNFDNMG